MSKKNELTFEEALNQLEEITRKLETGGLSLDESLKSYERGMELRKICQETLEKAEARLEYLEKKASGEVVRKPIDPESVEDSLF
ncbi:MAG: exodeoxyribonuclease VII small subunit [Spirochaetales bacterium]|nr:exodeoxyribonuclease VII small subunit [Spirochaetales bacterium]